MAVRRLPVAVYIRRLLVFAAFARQALPVPLANHGVVTCSPFTAGLKKVQHIFFCVAESNMRFCYLPHADKYDHAFKETEQFVSAYDILLRAEGKFLIKGVLIVHDLVIIRGRRLNGPQA